MLPALLLFFERHDRRGVHPLETYLCPEDPSFLREVNMHLGNKSFISSQSAPSRSQEFPWDRLMLVKPSDVDLEAEADYGPVYSKLAQDNMIVLPTDSYQAAVELVKGVLLNKVLIEEMEDVYPLAGFTVEDILESPEPLLADPRFALGDIVVDRYLDRYTYTGTLPGQRGTLVKDGNTVQFDRCLDSFVKEEDFMKVFAEQDYEVHPIPRMLQRHVVKGYKWFALSKTHKTLEGFGPTQKKAKENLAHQVAVAKMKAAWQELPETK